MPEPRFAGDRPIMLVGMMGAGKTTAGRLLAERLGLAFVDSDEEVERATGLRIATIFERFGEGRFREEERRVLARLVAGAPQVIAAGGGAFEDAGTRALVLARCVTVWLDAPLATLAERVGRGAGRPLIGGGDVPAALRALAARREAAYAEAPLRVNAEGTPEEVAAALLEALAERTQ